MKLVIDLDHFNLEGMNDYDASLIMRDALGEFISNRAPVPEYVATRYRAQSDKFRRDKEAEVARRVVWAALIKSGSVKLEK